MLETKRDFNSKSDQISEITQNFSIQDNTLTWRYNFENYK